MPEPEEFLYRATDADGGLRTGAVRARTQQEALARLTQDGLQVKHIQPRSALSAGAASTLPWFFYRGRDAQGGQKTGRIQALDESAARELLRSGGLGAVVVSAEGDNRSVSAPSGTRLFHYKARDPEGQAIMGCLEAAGETEARQDLLQRGLMLESFASLDSSPSPAPAAPPGKPEPFMYRATDARGGLRTGHLEAVSLEAARQQLEARGFRIKNLSPLTLQKRGPKPTTSLFFYKAETSEGAPVSGQLRSTSLYEARAELEGQKLKIKDLHAASQGAQPGASTPVAVRGGFLFKAKDGQGAVRTGELQAGDLKQAREQLEGRGWRIISLVPRNQVQLEGLNKTLQAMPAVEPVKPAPQPVAVPMPVLPVETAPPVRSARQLPLQLGLVVVGLLLIATVVAGIGGLWQASRPKQWTVRIRGRILRPTAMARAEGPAYRSAVQVTAWFPQCRRRFSLKELPAQAYHLEEDGNFTLDLSLVAPTPPTVGYLNFEREGYQKKQDVKVAIAQADPTKTALLGSAPAVRLRPESH